jgi:hypothetical protein
MRTYVVIGASSPSSIHIRIWDGHLDFNLSVVGIGIPSMDLRDNDMLISSVFFNFQNRTFFLVRRLKEACSPESSSKEGQSKQPNQWLPSRTAASIIFKSWRFMVVCVVALVVKYKIKWRGEGHERRGTQTCQWLNDVYMTSVWCRNFKPIFVFWCSFIANEKILQKTGNWMQASLIFDLWDGLHIYYIYICIVNRKRLTIRVIGEEMKEK